MKKLSTLFSLLWLVSGTSFAFQVTSFNLNVGDTYLVDVNQTQEISQIFMGTPNTLNTINASNERVEVVAVTDGIYTLTVTTLTQRTEVSSPMMSQVLDSEDATTGDGLYAALKESSYSFTMDKTGEILSVDGLDEMIETIRAGLTDNPMVAAQVDGILNEETIVSTLKQRYSFFPANGESEWTEEMVLTMNDMPITMNTTFSYETDSTIKGISEITIAATTTQMGANVELDLTGKQTSTFTLNESTGFPTEFVSTSDISGNASTQGMQIPMTIRTNSKITFTLEQ